MDTNLPSRSTLLRRQIQQLRVSIDNGDRHFIPQRVLYKLLTREEILRLVTTCNVAPYHVNELVETIVNGARRIFAILILLKGEERFISRFVEFDDLQRSALDYKLPFSKERLKFLVPAETVDDFYELQWEFVAPVFSKGVAHRVLDSKIRLPFVCDEDTGKEGGFGHIYEVQIHPDCHKFTATSGESTQPRFVRKEFFPNTSAHGSFENEIHNLNLLNSLKHPNILELLGSYTYRGKHNALFPYATGGDLSAFMARDSRSSHFLEHSEFYRALGELSSAIQKVHHYASEQLNLTLIGVHHDLKPQNIFVQAGTFILADFGLSKFKQIDQSSKSLFKIGEGHYLAPECEDYEDDFKKHTISRPSDIWSFGCILAEMLTYMFRGAVGVAEFKRSREIKIGSWKTYTFHAGRDKRNPGVIVWLKGLDSEITETGRMLLRLINSMLSMNPEARPTADRVTSSLHYAALDAYSRSIEGQYELLLKEVVSTELDIESQRFRSWLWAVRSYENNDDPWNSRIYSLFDSSPVLKTLVQVRDELRSIRSRYEDAESPLFLDLCLLNDRLMALLPWEIQERAKTSFELQIIQTEDITLLAERQVSSGESSLHRKIAILATMKRMNLLVSERTETCRSDLHLELKSVKILEPFEDHSLGLYKDPSGTAPRRVLIEWVRYDTHWEGRVSKEMYARMEAIAELLHSSSSKPNDLRVLTCAGFFHNPPRFSFGFVYDFPSDVSSSPNSGMVPRSLAEIIEGTKSSRNRPSLDDRFNLARVITSSLLEFHKVGWMHKSISAYNILFLTTSDAPTQDWLKTPYIVGFNRSRPDQPLAFTEGPDTDLKSQSYQHARYAENRSRFRVGFDYYSLGLVLLEIGLWQTLEELVAKMGASTTLPSEETREKLLMKRVPMLNHAMGNGYFRATHACMTWIGSEHDNPDADEQKAASLLAFERLVVEPIGKCSV